MEPVTIKIQSHTGIAASVPHLLGFIPAESLVLIGLEGPRDRMAFAMRVDLPVADEDAALAREMTGRLHMTGFERALVVVYTETALDGTELPHAALVAALQACLEVREALLVRSHRVWSYLCDNPDCCPPAGRTYLDGADATNVAAAHVLAGRSVLMTRQQVIDSITPVREATAAVSTALPIARAAVTTMTTDARVGALGRLLAVTLARLDDPRAELTVEEVAQFVTLLDDVRVRDSFLRRLTSTDDPACRLLVTQLARKTPAGQDSQVSCALALRAYLDGDGVLARAGLDRALADGQHTLASTLENLLDQGVHPREIREIFVSSENDPSASAGGR